MASGFAIGEALNETFNFAVSRWGSVLRYGWAPLLAASAVLVLMLYAIVDIGALEEMEKDPQVIVNAASFLRAPVPVAILAFLATGAFITFIMAGFLASVYRLAALGEDAPGFIHLRFDGPALRVFFANIIQTAINYSVYLVALLIASLATGVSIGSAFGAIMEFVRIVSEAAQADQAVDPAAIGASVEPIGLFFVAGLFAALPAIYLNVRLAPFVSGSAAENRLILAGAFRLTAGRFWPLFGYFLLLALALLVLTFVFQIAMAIFETLTALPAGGVFSIISAIASLIAFALGLGYQIFTFSLQLGGQGIIYRRLKTGA
ncbi:MAG: hypothetical protein AAFW81_05290 [Pseudomonadota bacterium]